MKDILTKKYAKIIDDPEAFDRAIQRPLPGTFWWNSKRGSTAALLNWFAEHNIQTTPLGWYPDAWRVAPDVSLGNTLPYIAGWICIQEEVALTAIQALDPQPGDRVCDMCASPGNKTAQISVRVGESGGVVANEKSGQRIAALGSKVEQLALTNVTVVRADAAALQLRPASFDRVLADVPCSGEGTVRKFKDGPRVPEARLTSVLPRQQAQILHRALRLTKPGGVVVYSTCTFSPEENEAVLHAALGDLGVVEPFETPGLESRPGLTSWEGEFFRSDIVHARRFYPHLNDTGGFFVARIRRTEVPYRRERREWVETPNDYVSLDADERSRALEWMEKRYGVDSSFFDQTRFLAKNRYVRFASHSCPEANAPICFQGMSGFERTSRGFMLMAYGAQHIAPHASRNQIALEGRQELLEYLAGRSQDLRRSLDIKGSVLVSYGDFHLGKGSMLEGVLESHLPRYLRLGLPPV